MIAQLLPGFNDRIWTGSQKKVEAFSYLEVDLYHPCLCQAVVEHTFDYGALSDLDDVWDILQWRKNDGEIAPTEEHEPLRTDLLYIAHIKFADVRASPSQSIQPGRRDRMLSHHSANGEREPKGSDTRQQCSGRHVRMD